MGSREHVLTVLGDASGTAITVGRDAAGVIAAATHRKHIDEVHLALAVHARTPSGAASRDRWLATLRQLVALGVPAFARTPDAFPELLARAIERGDLQAWAHRNDLAKR
jgi:hypothetical protein